MLNKRNVCILILFIFFKIFNFIVLLVNFNIEIYIILYLVLIKICFSEILIFCFLNIEKNVISLYNVIDVFLIMYYDLK